VACSKLSTFSFGFHLFLSFFSEFVVGECLPLDPSKLPREFLCFSSNLPLSLTPKLHTISFPISPFQGDSDDLNVLFIPFPRLPPPYPRVFPSRGGIEFQRIGFSWIFRFVGVPAHVSRVFPPAAIKNEIPNFPRCRVVRNRTASCIGTSSIPPLRSNSLSSSELLTLL